jgi:peptide deformylase
MATHQLIKSDNLLLTIPLSNVSEEADRKQIKEDLFETMDNFKGIGLSGNQVGIMERVFVMYSNFTKREKIVCFNPKIILASETEEFMDEGCLSFPGLWLKVKRPSWIEVEYENENGEVIKDTFTDLTARVFQHEMDHMEGVDFTKKVSRLRLDRAKKRATKQRKKIINMSLSRGGLDSWLPSDAW